MKKDPNTSKGRKRLYEVAAVVWFDLLGYGSMLEKVRFDPTEKDAQIAIDRLRLFHAVAAKAANRHFRIHAINDGIIAFRDLSPRSKSVTFTFLDKAIKLFGDFNEREHRAELPGARMVIAAGFRIRGKKDAEFNEHGQIKSIHTRLINKVISPEQAIIEAFNTRPHFGVIPEIQTNFAFTKAYLADSAGSKGGFSGPNCYIDLSFFNEVSSNWIEFEKIIHWEKMGMKSSFGMLKSFNREKANSVNHNGILDAFDVAANISSQTQIKNVLKESTLRPKPR